jgi:predicted ATPase
MSTAPDPTTSPDDEGVQPPRPPFIRRVRIRNYKSIAFCDVTLEPLTILVGRNASGKSNFLDALAFVRDVEVDGLRTAITKHGGPDAILCLAQPGRDVEIEFEGTGWSRQRDFPVPYRYRLAVRFPNGGEAHAAAEEFNIQLPGKRIGYKHSNGRGVLFTDEDSSGHHTVPLTHGSQLAYFKNAAQAVSGAGLSRLTNYGFDPARIRTPQPRHAGGFLVHDGRNLAGVLRAMREADPFWFDRINDYLRAVTPDIQIASTLDLGGFEILKFTVITGDAPPPVELTAASMSDGTLRVVAALVAAFQEFPPDGSPSLVAIEEPETALHPAAMRALVSALDEATLRTQVLLTTHSPDLLDAEEVKPANVRVVRMIDGKTVIGPVDAADIEIVERELNTLAGLEREDRLDPDLDDIERQQRLADEPRGAGE